MWKRFTQEAHAYLGLPSRPFSRPDNVVTKNCGGQGDGQDQQGGEDLFVQGVTPTKPGACRPPESGTPTPSVPKFPPRTTPSPTPSPTRAPSPTPTSTPSPTPTPKEQLYIVRPGDTLQGIADQFGITLQELLQANGLTKESVIKPGDKLIIPANSGGAGRQR